MVTLPGQSHHQLVFRSVVEDRELTPIYPRLINSLGDDASTLEMQYGNGRHDVQNGLWHGPRALSINNTRL